MARGRGCGNGRGGMRRSECRCDGAPAPRAAEVQAVEMRVLAVAAVGDGRGGEEGRGLLRGGAGEEGVPPAGEIAIAAADDGPPMRLGARRGEASVPAWFQRPAVAVSAAHLPRTVVVRTLAAPGKRVRVRVDP